MICSPTNALNMFYGSDVQYLIMENVLVMKEGVEGYSRSTEPRVLSLYQTIERQTQFGRVAVILGPLPGEVSA